MTFTTSLRRAAILALPGLVAVTLVFTGIAGAALAQDRTLVIGNRGGNPIQVDLSVLDGDGGEVSPGPRELLFPGSTFIPGQRIILRRPGTRPQRVKLRKPRRQPAQRSIRRMVAAPPMAPKRATAKLKAPPPPAVVMPAAKPRVKPKKKLSAPAKAKPTRERRRTAKVVVPPRTKLKPKPKSRATAKPKAPPPPAAAMPAAKPEPKSRATAKLKAPPLAPPTVMKKPKPTAAPPLAAVPPIPAPPKAVRKAIPEPPKAVAKPTPAPRRVAAAPRAPVTSTPLAKTAPAKAKSPAKQVASIPRLGPIASGSKRRILFVPGSARLEADGQAILGPISAALTKNPRLRVELKAYARGNAETFSQARRLSLSRALAIRSHLIKRGIKATRIDVRALGSKVADGVPNRVDLLVFTR